METKQYHTKVMHAANDNCLARCFVNENGSLLMLTHRSESSDEAVTVQSLTYKKTIEQILGFGDLLLLKLSGNCVLLMRTKVSNVSVDTDPNSSTFGSVNLATPDEETVEVIKEAAFDVTSDIGEGDVLGDISFIQVDKIPTPCIIINSKGETAKVIIFSIDNGKQDDFEWRVSGSGKVSNLKAHALIQDGYGVVLTSIVSPGDGVYKNMVESTWVEDGVLKGKIEFLTHMKGVLHRETIHIAKNGKFFYLTSSELSLGAGGKIEPGFSVERTSYIGREIRVGRKTYSFDPSKSEYPVTWTNQVPVSENVSASSFFYKGEASFLLLNFNPSGTMYADWKVPYGTPIAVNRIVRVGNKIHLDYEFLTDEGDIETVRQLYISEEVVVQYVDEILKVANKNTEDEV